MAELSVVVPVYGCADCLRALHQRLEKGVGQVTSDYELIFVDDRSTDDAWTVLQEISLADPHVRALRLSRNFGQHAATTAGLAHARGRWTVVMDCDLQDPPEEIPRLYAKALEGHDIVLSRRRVRKQSALRRIAGSIYYRLSNVLLKTTIHTNYTNLSIISRKVREAFLSLRDKDRQYLLIVHWLGFDKAEIEVEPADRYAGRSAYSLGQLIRVATDGLFFQSTVFLRWIVYGGFLMAGVGLLLAAYTLISYAAGRSLPDWTALPVLILILAGFIIVSTGVTGLYIGKIFDQVKGRPLFVIDAELSRGEERTVLDEGAIPAQSTGADQIAPVGERSAGNP